MSLPFVGSRISLISKSNIRFVGILHSINQQESSISLEQVKSHGTEGRMGNPSEEIPPSDQIFSFIIFRGADIKDLHVITNAPAPAPPPAQPVMPAGYPIGPGMNPYYAQQQQALAFQQQQQQQYWQQSQQQTPQPAVPAPAPVP
ncbi:Scd6-like Sm domain-containing protein, partial [Entophlyctis helioformis]